MPWWGWIVIGCFLLAAELLGVDAAFYLIFVGFAAVLTGLLGLAGITLPEWAQWLTFAVIALASMVLFRARLYKRFRGVAEGYGNTLIGELVETGEDIASGHRARVRLRGTKWTAVNVGESTIASGQSAEVVEADGTVLKIRNVLESTTQGDS